MLYLNRYTTLNQYTNYELLSRLQHHKHGVTFSPGFFFVNIFTFFTVFIIRSSSPRKMANGIVYLEKIYGKQKERARREIEQNSWRAVRLLLPLYP